MERMYVESPVRIKHVTKYSIKSRVSETVPRNVYKTCKNRTVTCVNYVLNPLEEKP